MKDEYRLILRYGSLMRESEAIFGDDIVLDQTREGGEQYFRRRLTGKFTFAKADYDWIMAQPLDAKILVEVQQWREAAGAYTFYENCYFYRTDCDINQDDRLITVELTTDDEYTDFLGALDKEIDLVRIAPRITPILLDKRPCLQVYTLGDSRLTNILSNMAWEQDCKVVDSADELTDTYKFKAWDEVVSVVVSGTHTPAIPAFWMSKGATPQPGNVQTRTLTSGAYTLVIRQLFGTSTVRTSCQLNDATQTLFEGGVTDSGGAFPMTVTLKAVAGSGATGTCILNIDIAQFFVRMISDITTIGSADTFEIPGEDIVETNRNYTRVSPVSPGGDVDIAVSPLLTSTPTRWGIYQPGEYYNSPQIVGVYVLPVCHNRWARVSYWITQSQALKYVEQEGRKTEILKDAYRLIDVFAAVLAEVAPTVSLYSDFLRGRDVLDRADPDDGVLFITPKSNLLNLSYTQPAQKAPITLRQLLDMLRVVYRCYWTLSTPTTLRIEHVEWFRRGGRYSGGALLGVDLTQNKTVRNGKEWSYLTNKYKFDKVEMPYRYEFGWMDDATEPFEGEPIEMMSNFVDKERIEKFEVSGFSSDIDYLMLNPSAASKDGFVIMKADWYNALSADIVRTGGIGTDAVLLEYEATADELIDIQYTSTGRVRLYAADKNGRRIINLAELNATTGGYGGFTLPDGTRYIRIEFLDDAVRFVLTELVPPNPKVLYQTYAPGGYTDGYDLQNGRLAFSYLRRYYLYDMPCWPYKVEGAQSDLAKGIAKNKTQEVSFPTPALDFADFDPQLLVRTGLGDGKIRKISINLSSRMAQATLEYDTQ